MQERHKNRKIYFDELARTSEKYFLPYVRAWHGIGPGVKVLEIGCGDGGNLLPFARLGCDVIGVDIAANKIDGARTFFAEAGAEATFIADDIFNIRELEKSFDIIICHDVFEHIQDKETFLANLADYLRPEGMVFMAFPAWQMPFGGHQQICRSKFLSHLPFYHLLPVCLYKPMLKAFGESSDRVDELLSIKECGLSIERFERLVKASELTVADRKLWFINPHYETKFGLKPRRLASFMSAIPYLRDFFSTSCFYVLR